jgi:hypothetical protein
MALMINNRNLRTSFVPAIAIQKMALRVQVDQIQKN